MGVGRGGAERSEPKASETPAAPVTESEPDAAPSAATDVPAPAAPAPAQ